MSRTTILFGPPGSGKTTSLLKEVETELKAGTPPNRIAYFAFTRKASREAIERAVIQFGFKADDLPWFRTLHSTAFKTAGLRTSEIMDTEHYRVLGGALGSFTFKHTYDENTERPPQGGGLGDKCLYVYALAQARMINPEDEWRTLNDPEVSLRDVLRFSAALDEYKRSYQIHDFNDILSLGQPPLDLDLLIIDEAQDLTARQWEFARRIGATAKRVLIAGDDDQAIYQWSGADVRVFLSLAGDLRVLPKSYRLPRSVWKRANDISARIKIRQPKMWSPRDADGQVAYLSSHDQAPLKEGSWLLLARHQYQLPALCGICRAQGTVYQFEGMWSNQTAAVRAVINYERLRQGETIPWDQFAAIVRFIPGMSRPTRIAGTATWETGAWPFVGQPEWMDALTGIGTDDREYIRRLRREGESLNKPGRIVISTIHGVKGGEADNVLVLPDISRRTYDGMQADPDQEARVFYVAASRASKALYLVSPHGTRFYPL